MITIPEIKRFSLRALGRMHGIPMPESQLEGAIRDAFAPPPLDSDIRQSVRELARAGLISGAHDPLDDQAVTWTLTTQGVHMANQLG